MSNTNYEEYQQLGSMSIYSYIVYCFLFFLLKGSLFPKTNENNSITWVIVYILGFFILLFMSNLSIFSNDLVCGEAQFGSAFYSTLYPLVFIFAVVALILELFPGWIRVFSNTFGISAAYMFGLKHILKDIFSESNKQYILQKDSVQTENDNDKYQFMKSIDLIYNDPLPVINEMDLVMEDVPTRISVEEYNADPNKANVR